MGRRGRIENAEPARGWFFPLLLALVYLAGSPSASAQGPIVQGCQPDQYLDRTAPAADRQLSWVLGIGTDPERCLQVRVGQTVVWNGNLVSHPLLGQEGDTPNPITSHQNGSVTFNAAGTFGFICEIHPSMRGAIRVVAPAPVPAVPPAFAVTLAVLLIAAGIRSLGRSRAA